MFPNDSINYLLVSVFLHLVYEASVVEEKSSVVFMDTKILSSLTLFLLFDELTPTNSYYMLLTQQC